MINRRKTRQIQIGNVKVGGGAPITVQSMTKTDTRDVQATLLEIWSLEAAGCDIVRCAVPVREAAEKRGEIKRQIHIPLVADIHFNYKLALIALEQGVDGLRLNPGKIGGKPFVQEVVNVAKEKQIPVRIGVNAGSLEKDLLAKHGGPTAEGMVESALRHIRILEDCNYPEMKISLKASDPRNLHLRIVAVFKDPDVSQRGLDHAFGGRPTVLGEKILLERARVDPEPNGNLLFLGDVHDLLYERLAADLSGVEAQAVDALLERDERQLVVEVDVGHEGNADLPLDLAELLGRLADGHRAPHDVAAGRFERPDLEQRRLDVARVGLRHRLHGERRVAADLHAAQPDRSE